MKKVIFIEQPKEETKKPVEFTQMLSINSGWIKTGSKPKEHQRVVYLGNCKLDGDMFAAYHDGGCIEIYKGHLNSGEY